MLKNIFVIAFLFGVASCVPISNDVSPADTVFDIFSRLCVSMLPEHGDSHRMPMPFPIAITLTPDSLNYEPGQSILVNLRGINNFYFTGFLIQARVAGSTVPLGHWVAGALGTVAGCANPLPDFSGDDTAAHQQGSNRTVQDMVFTMPTTPGSYRLEMTTVERFGVYWMDQFVPFNVV